MSDPLCVSLEEVRRVDLAVAGGKAANLGELLHAGFDVPPGFVVTTHAYRAAVGSARSLDDVRAAALPLDVDDAIRQAYRSMHQRPVAVRSSATAEDLPGAAFAGQQDTFLDVHGEDAVVEAVQSCWASLFTDRAVAYRERLGIDDESVAMAVVVQAMVPADVAGVVFTADPVTGARDRVVIAAARGLGESVVSGEVVPESFTVDDRDRLVARRLVGVPSLTQAQVRDLAAVGRRIAQHFGAPQDIEWALQGERLSILQARSMTALPPAPVALNRFQRFIGPTLLEMLPRRPYPMELTAWIIPTVAAHVADMMEQLAGVRISWEEMLPARDGIVSEFVPPTPHPTAAVPLRILRTGARGLVGSAAQWRQDPLSLAYRSGAAELDGLDPRGLSLEELVGVPRRAARLVELMTRLRVERLPSGMVGLLGLRLALVGRTGVLAELVGHALTMTRAANDELAALAAQAAVIPDVRRLVLAGAPAHAAATTTSPAAAAWWRRFQHFLTTYGHRETTSVLLVHDPAWVDSPTTVMGMIRVLMDEKGPGGEKAASSKAAPARRSRLVRALGRRAAEGVAFREDTHFELTRTGPAVRRAINEVGRRLVGAGVLDDPEDVWMLTLDEVSGRDVLSGSTSLLRATAARRRVAWAELAASPLIASTTLYPHRRSSSDALVTGAAGGGGRASGTVRIIDGPEHFGELRAGEVLVCVATNPSWTPLFQRAAAVVVDNGGVASHAAIVAREYGLPAVMGAVTATSVLHDGQRVVVDGDRGEVTSATGPT